MAQCNKKAAFRYIWSPGQEGYICFEHSKWMMQVANAVGHTPQFVILEHGHEHKCEQQVSGKVDSSERKDC